MRVRFCDEWSAGFGWIVGEPLQRCSHALVAAGRVWPIDPVDGEGVEERIREAGEPAGVIQLLDRHDRDCASLARRLGVPHHRVPHEPIAGAPFTFALVRKGRAWQEVALWWPAERVLVCADALGTAPYYRSSRDRLGVHPILRLIPPRRRLGGFEPRMVFVGHGEGLLDSGAGQALREALATARRRLPAAYARVLTSALARRDQSL